MRADPATSAGARAERVAFRKYLRRKISIEGTNSTTGKALNAALLWVLLRQKRYDRRPGGLGRIDEWLTDGP